MPGPVESAFLALKAAEHLCLPALPDPLDPHGGEVDRHAVLEARAEQRVHVRVRGSSLAAMLVDGEHALGARAAPRKVFSTASRRTRSQKVP